MIAGTKKKRRRINIDCTLLLVPWEGLERVGNSLSSPAQLRRSLMLIIETLEGRAVPPDYSGNERRGEH